MTNIASRSKFCSRKVREKTFPNWPLCGLTKTWFINHNTCYLLWSRYAAYLIRQMDWCPWLAYQELRFVVFEARPLSTESSAKYSDTELLIMLQFGPLKRERLRLIFLLLTSVTFWGDKICIQRNKLFCIGFCRKFVVLIVFPEKIEP